MAAEDHTRATDNASRPPSEEAALASRRRRVYAGILAGFLHDASAARGSRPAPEREG